MKEIKTQPVIARQKARIRWPVKRNILAGLLCILVLLLGVLGGAQLVLWRVEGDFHELMDLAGALFFSSPTTTNYVVSQSVMIKLRFVFAAVMVLFTLGLGIIFILLWKFYGRFPRGSIYFDLIGFNRPEKHNDTGLIKQESQQREESFRATLQKQRATSERVCSVVLQVSHDIRSPLSVLSLVIPTLSELPEEKREIVLRAAKRINDMANKLLQTGQTALKEVQALECRGSDLDEPDF